IRPRLRARVRRPFVCVSMTTEAWNNFGVGDKLRFLVDRIAVLLNKEDSFYSRSENDLIDKIWRQKAASWMVRDIDAYNLDRDIASVAMAHLDEVLSVSSLHHVWNKKKCCILVMASLKLAIKLYEPRKMSMDAMLAMGRIMEFFVVIVCIFRRIPHNYKILALLILLVNSVDDIFVKLKASSTRFASCLIAVFKASGIPQLNKLLTHSHTVPTLAVSLDDDCQVTHETMAIFLKRIFHSFGLLPGDKCIRFLKRRLRALLHYNTDLNGSTLTLLGVLLKQIWSECHYSVSVNDGTI
ncbi:LOW QUALITY PROTEIN: hypothetical protein ACHAXA_010626, partial [Cyclostephanos tholiformis]